MNVRCGFAALLIVTLLCALAPLSLRAAAPKVDDGKKEFPYRLVIIGGKAYRFNRASGELEPLPVPDEKPGTRAVKPARQPKKHRNHKPVIEFLPGIGEDLGAGRSRSGDGVPAVILDVDRERAAKDVRAYLPKLGLSQLLHVGSKRIKGVVSVSNKGARKLLALELTVFVPTRKGDPVKYRIVLGYRKGQPRPPAPIPSPGVKSRTEFINVNFPTPPGVSGRTYIEPTYIRFDED